ncbi:COPII vesicle coat protein [Schizosaccharomyces japonicus yFS275]|uniref:COPII vesicle coat protein n=1 Tax=Schizosaccharomyces japonicus (strain yFS275 / FY16936) TaxID=402676 RepID=B6JUX3_SCHJY|nr:COPII vesicle coat protein [Schizosaccharomyces japonicus yFS275]EEB05077.1 COPII vesicle coat protein [Schizosaccharomyces japonicus yFS275]
MNNPEGMYTGNPNDPGNGYGRQQYNQYAGYSNVNYGPGMSNAPNNAGYGAPVAGSGVISPAAAPFTGSAPLGSPPTGAATPTGTVHKSRRQYPAELFELTNAPAEPAISGAYGAAPAGNVAKGYPSASSAYPVDPSLVSEVPSMANLNDQFSNMNVRSDASRQLMSVELTNQPADVTALHEPRPLAGPSPVETTTGSPNANCPQRFQTSTLNAIPNTSGLLKKSKLPFAVIVRPFPTLLEEDDPVPVTLDTTISRCRRCRTYIHPFTTFIDNGHRYRCTACNIINDVPQAYDWDSFKNVSRDRWQRPELNNGAVDFIAPQDYMVRPPAPPVYVFLIDVSFISISCGMVATATRTILESLDRIPNADGRTRVAFIAVDSSLHFFSIPLGSDEPSQLVVSDLEEPFLPLPQDLLLNLKESRQGIENLLTHFNDMFVSSRDSSNALGPALKSAYKLIENIGGKIICLNTSLPNVGAGKLLVREDPKMLGTSRESNLLHAQESFYKSFAVDCSTSQISVDMFLFSAQYQDVATLSCLPRYTSGSTRFYQSWNASRSEDAVKFASEFGDHLSQEFGLEGVMRVRATAGVRVSSFYGNFFNRSSDLCSFPYFPRDQSYVIELNVEDTITKPFVLIQTAVLYSTCFGERRIRVLTTAIPVTQSLSDVYAAADQRSIAHYLIVRAADRALTSKLDDARDSIISKLIEIVEVYKKHLAGQNTGAALPLQICENLKLLPLLCLAASKHLGLRRSSQIVSDLRAFALCFLTTLPQPLLLRYVYPTFYALHSMAPEAGTVGENGVILPTPLNLTSAVIESYGLYLIDSHVQQFLFIGKDAVPQLVLDAFGVNSLAELKPGRFTMPVTESPLNARINAILAKLRSLDKGTTVLPSLYLVRGDVDPQLRAWFLSHLIEDRSDTAPSYMQYLQSLKERINR